jgi:uncharacterized membrane protein
MENKHVGYLILGLAAVIIGIIYLFNSAMVEIVHSSCSMEENICPMYRTISTQTYLSLGIACIIGVIGIVLILVKPKEKVVVRRVKEKIEKREIDTRDLRAEDKAVLKVIQENKTIFQADLIEKTGFGKAKVTRILDRLENKEIIERKRRGMTNVVVLRE